MRAVRAWASGIDLSPTDDELCAFYREQAARRMSIMCDSLAVVGKPTLLMVHSKEYWLPKQAIRNIGKFKKMLDIVWAEELVRRWDANGL